MGRVIFLGTGDPLNGERAQASIAVPLAEDEAMLIDVLSGPILLRQLKYTGIPLECVGFHVAQGGATMVYAADTRPCQTVVEHARDADLLIHEAYGQEGGAEQAHFLGHSNAEEAGEAAHKAGARRLVLTHLRESRFADPEELKSEAESASGLPVEVACDLDTFDF